MLEWGCTFHDLLVGFAKAIVFGMIATIVPCAFGPSATRGGDGRHIRGLPRRRAGGVELRP